MPNYNGVWSLSTQYQYNTDWPKPPTPNRAVFMGGNNSDNDSVNTIEYVSLASTGNAADFGDLTVATARLGALSSSTRAVACGGVSGINTMCFITFNTLGNATDFGDLSANYSQTSATSNSTRGIIFAGYNGSSNTNIIEYITIAATGNATDFGNLTQTQSSSQGLSSTTRAVRCGGFQRSMDYITIASTGNATTFGDLTDRFGEGNEPGYLSSGNISSGTRGIIAPVTRNTGTPVKQNWIEYIAIATTGNSTDFGDLLQTVTNSPGAASNTTRGVVAGGTNTNRINVINDITIASTGNATDFGDLTVIKSFLSGASASHGGIA
jgi:hypothetical protein